MTYHSRPYDSRTVQKVVITLIVVSVFTVVIGSVYSISVMFDSIIAAA